MTSRQLILILVVLLALGAIAVFGSSIMSPRAAVSPSPSPIENEEPSASTTLTFMARLGQKVGNSDIVITPIEIVEDSRCPANVNCIQAGTVRVTVDVTAKNIYSQHILTLDKPLAIGDQVLVLTRVLPNSIAGVKIPDADYNLTFELRKK